MTPLQVILLTHRVRQAQKAFQSALKGEAPLGERHKAMADLEDQLDAVLEPYIDYHRSMELQETANGN